MQPIKPIYLDNNATTRVANEVFEEIKPYFCDQYGNPSSMHVFGGQVGAKIKQARQRVADLLGCSPSEIIFTGCGTESDNTAIQGTLAAYPNKRKIITREIQISYKKSNHYDHCCIKRNFPVAIFCYQDT